MRHHTSPRPRPSNHLPTTPSWNSRKRRKIPHSILPCFALRSALYREKPPPHLHHLLQKPPLFPTHLTGTCPHATRHRQTPNQHQHSLQPHFRIPRHHLHHHLPHPLPALRTLSSSPPMFPFYPKHVRGTHQSIPPGWAPQLYHAPHSATPTRIPLQVTIPRPHRNGQLLPFNFSTDIKHYLNPTAHSTRRPATSRPAPPTHFHPTTTTNTTTVFPPVPPIPDAPLTEQQAATLQQTILRIACQAAAAAAAELNSRRSSS